jgi:hypothetical protein
MGREIRMVPPNWQHPKDERGQLRPMYRGNFADKFTQWLADFDRVRAGDLDEIERECYAKPGMNPLAEWLRDEGMPLRPNGYEPWRKEDATWIQVWETVSEGTPVTPAFPTASELVNYLVAHGDFWDQRRGNGGYTRAQAEAFVKSGWAPSMMVCGDKITTGIAIPAAIAADAETT